MRDTVRSEAQPLTGTVAAVSVGGVLLLDLDLDLDYEEEVKAETATNVVCLDDARFVEVQGHSPSAVSNSTPCTGLVPQPGRLGVAALQDLTPPIKQIYVRPAGERLTDASCMPKGRSEA